MKRQISCLPLLLFFTASTLLAQDDATATPMELSNGAKAAFAGFCFIWIIFLVIWLGVWLGIAIWVTKDAKRRQSPNATLVTVLAWIPPTTVIGLIIHLVTRPKTIPGAPNS
jgi:heme/copper-type cytochrome/quinol oxidase subunit 2